MRNPSRNLSAMSGGYGAPVSETLARHVQSGFFHPASQDTPPREGAPRPDDVRRDDPFAFFPVWDLRTKAASVLRCEPRGAKDTNALNEIEMLRCAADCAARIRSEGLFGAVASTVSFDTMSERRSRARFLTDLHRMEFKVRAPLMLRLAGIPEDATRENVTEIVRSLTAPFVLVAVEAPNFGALIDAVSATGAAGYGLSFAEITDPAHAEQTADAIVRLADGQRALGFAEDLNDPALVEICARKGIRYGTGEALPHAAINLDNALPKLPLRA
jgi:hypothetical protein